MKILHWLSQRKTTALCLASLMAIAPAVMKLDNSAAQANPLSDDSEYPLDLTVGEMDGSWREFRISGQYEFADLIQTWFSIFGISNTYGNTYFTQGETIEVAGKEYLVAYRFPSAPQEIDLEAMFNVWDTGQECEDMSQLESQLISPESPLQLSLLNPITIGSLNDIKAVSVTSLVDQSKERFAMMQEACKEVEAENMVLDAIDDLRLINRSQQAFWLENQTFAADLETLQTGLTADTENYTYFLSVESDLLTTSQAIAKSPTGHHIVGGVYALDESVYGYPSTVTILCEKTEAGGQPPSVPKFDEGLQDLVCPVGTLETY